MEAKKEIAENQLKIQEEYFIITQENKKIMNKIRNLIYLELDKDSNILDKNISIQEYINQLVHNKYSIFFVNYCENKIIDAILYNKALLCKKYSIPISIEVYLKDNLNIEEVDIISIYTNLLDNAIEASKFVKEPYRSITIHSRLIKNYLVIKISNTYNKEKINQDFSTTKETKENHGWGINIIKTIVRKYDGTLKIKQDGQTIEFSLTLKNN